MNITKQIAAETKAALKDKDGIRACQFFETLLTHSKGEWAGRKFNLLDWQRNLIARLFGTKREDGTRKYREAYLEIPRKNGKSEIGAGIALKLLMSDGEAGAEVYSAAADKEQASLVFNAAKAMVEQNAHLRRELQIYRSAIVFPKRGGTYKAISSEAYTKHGINASGIIFDELHAQPNAELWDVLTTSTGSRRQPLTVAITTAGFDRESLCWRMHEHAKRILKGEIEDPSFLAMIYAADIGEDWTDPKVWARVNPSMGTALNPSYMQGECLKALQIPGRENTFRRLHLNQWTENDVRWLRMEDWAACGNDEDMELIGSECFGGLDLASKLDLNAFALWFPKQRAALVHFWLPADNLKQKMDRDRVPYEQWEKEGWLTLTEGNSVDQEQIRAYINRQASLYDIKEIGFDPWNATQMSYWLQDDGAKVWELRQGFQTLSEPTKEFERAVVSHSLKHDNNPVMRWQLGNVITKEDDNGNIKPDKKKSRGRIDGIAALVMAMACAMREPPKAKSVYESRGVRLL
jgi:phage terminase large subunit-like protein